MSFKLAFFAVALISCQANAQMEGLISPFISGYANGLSEMARPFVQLGQSFMAPASEYFSGSGYGSGKGSLFSQWIPGANQKRPQAQGSYNGYGSLAGSFPGASEIDQYLPRPSIPQNIPFGNEANNFINEAGSFVRPPASYLNEAASFSPSSVQSTLEKYASNMPGQPNFSGYAKGSAQPDFSGYAQIPQQALSGYAKGSAQPNLSGYAQIPEQALSAAEKLSGQSNLSGYAPIPEQALSAAGKLSGQTSLSGSGSGSGSGKLSGQSSLSGSGSGSGKASGQSNLSGSVKIPTV